METPSTDNGAFGLSSTHLAVIFFSLLGIVIGYVFGRLDERKHNAEIPRSVGVPQLMATEKSNMLALEQAKTGDFVITDEGEVFKLGGSMRKSVVEGDRVYFDTRFTSGGHYHKSLYEMAQKVVRIVKVTEDHRHSVIDLCFISGERVTTKGSEAWTCNI